VSIQATCCSQTTTKAQCGFVPSGFFAIIVYSIRLCVLPRGQRCKAEPLSCSCSGRCD
jgi:hypothetical protein